jgi:transcriptional regulator with XRE-family HTH domain
MIGYKLAALRGVNMNRLKRKEIRLSPMEIVDRRERKGWSQEQLAGTSGLSLSTIQRAEKHGRVWPETRMCLADALGVDVEKLMRGRTVDNSCWPENLKLPRITSATRAFFLAFCSGSLDICYDATETYEENEHLKKITTMLVEYSQQTAWERSSESALLHLLFNKLEKSGFCVFGKRLKGSGVGGFDRVLMVICRKFSENVVENGGRQYLSFKYGADPLGNRKSSRRSSYQSTHMPGARNLLFAISVRREDLEPTQDLVKGTGVRILRGRFAGFSGTVEKEPIDRRKITLKIYQKDKHKSAYSQMCYETVYAPRLMSFSSY